MRPAQGGPFPSEWNIKSAVGEKCSLSVGPNVASAGEVMNALAAGPRGGERGAPAGQEEGNQRRRAGGRWKAAAAAAERRARRDGEERAPLKQEERNKRLAWPRK